jgi:hypothetical protein
MDVAEDEKMRPTTRERGRRLNNDTGDTKMRPAAKDAT